jgi:hypothetical protein
MAVLTALFYLLRTSFLDQLFDGGRKWWNGVHYTVSMMPDRAVWWSESQ